MIGLGTWALRGRECAETVAAALAAGYRHVDTAASYGNETEVGEGIRAAGVERSAVFVTTKVPESSLADGACQRAIEASLGRLGLDQVDLVLIHWPSRRMRTADMIRPLCDAKRRGLCRHIGVSNFNVALLAEAWQATSEPIVANQCEYHPHLNQDRLLAACREAGTAFIAYCPLGRGTAFSEPAVAAAARSRHATPAQVVLRWLIQQEGVAAIPKTRSRARLTENLAAPALALSAEEMGAISALTARRDRICDASWPVWDR